MHPFRLLLVTALLTSPLSCLHAEDDWFLKQFASSPATSPTALAPRPVLAQRSKTALPAATASAATGRAWRTVVIPAAPQSELFTRAAFTPRQKTPPPQLKPLTGYAHELSGLASFYWQEQQTSSGERFDRHGMTAAHKTLPLGTRVRVTNLANGRSTIVRINDRGPFKAGRVIDLSEAAAQQIDMTGPGIARVAIDVVQ